MTLDDLRHADDSTRELWREGYRAGRRAAIDQGRAAAFLEGERRGGKRAGAAFMLGFIAGGVTWYGLIEAFLWVTR